jgi:uncharacterized protein
MKRSLAKLAQLNAPRLADPIHRLTSRWKNGGVELYPLSENGEKQRKKLRRLFSDFEITRHRIRLDRLPSAFRGFRIVQLTDIHHGVFLAADILQHVVHTVNELEPDLVVLTGDYITYSSAYIEPVAEILGQLRPKHGIIGVLGNHDFRVDADRVARTLSRAGVEMLRNRHTRIHHRDQYLYIAGVDDWYYRPDLPRALRGIPKKVPTVLLSHNPSIVQSASDAGIPLVLSGHTHGGQLNLPILGSIYGRTPEQLRFKVGWARLGPTQIYVSRGIGTIVLPLRVRCSPEIPVLTLDSTSHAA